VNLDQLKKIRTCQPGLSTTVQVFSNKGADTDTDAVQVHYAHKINKIVA
jgi:hypothetical protein